MQRTPTTVSAAEGYMIFLDSHAQPRQPHGESDITALLNHAKTLKKGSWRNYSDCKRRLDGLNITMEQYQQTHRKLIDILHV